MHTIESPILSALFSSTARVRLLSVLLRTPGERFYLRQLQGITGISPRSVQLELRNLVEAGILERAVSGNRTYYWADERCPILPELRGMFTKTAGVADAMGSALEPLRKRIMFALIYGSMASGRDKPASDVDLLVIGSATFSQVVRTVESAQDSLGREINPTVMTEDEVRARAKRNDHFLSSLRRGPKIMLIGDADEFDQLAQ
jgi:predicted nucleotidyltransferase